MSPLSFARSVPRPTLRPALLALSSVCALSLAARPAEGQTDRRTLSGSRVSVYNIAGEMRIERGRGRDVEIEVTRRGADGDRLRIETGSMRGTQTLRVVYPSDDIVYRGRASSRDGRPFRGNTESRVRDDGTWGNWNGDFGRGRRVRVSSDGRGVEAWADIVVRVPDGQAVDAYLLVGELSAVDVDGTVTLDAASARVSAERMRGVLNLDTGSGGVSVRDVRVSTLDVDVGSGSIQLDDVRADDCNLDSGSGGVSGRGVSCRRFSLDIGSGSLRLDDASLDDVSIDTGSGAITLGLRTTPRRFSAESGSGSVTLGLPASFDATLEIETGSGSITSDFPVRTTRMERRSLRGTVGDGRNSLRVETGSGSVRLRRADP
ncbi:MAG: DUF4097 domain-containing protein [Gemmatimonadetes bacterium]|nr:DUF4097 domain-containing protein [Gemmatimonadota bacterium]